MLGEIDNFIHEKRLIEAHILRTRTWIENLGKWRVHVYGAEVYTVDSDIVDIIFINGAVSNGLCIAFCD